MLTTTDLHNLTLAISVPTIELAAHEPPLEVLKDVFRANLVRGWPVVLGTPRQQFVLVVGQFRPAMHPTATNGIDRDGLRISANICYSTSANFVPLSRI